MANILKPLKLKTLVMALSLFGHSYALAAGSGLAKSQTVTAPSLQANVSAKTVREVLNRTNPYDRIYEITAKVKGFSGASDEQDFSIEPALEPGDVVGLIDLTEDAYTNEDYLSVLVIKSKQKFLEGWTFWFQINKSKVDIKQVEFSRAKSLLTATDLDKLQKLIEMYNESLVMMRNPGSARPDGWSFKMRGFVKKYAPCFNLKGSDRSA